MSTKTFGVYIKKGQKYFGKREITTSQVYYLLIALAKKYDLFTSEDENNLCLLGELEGALHLKLYCLKHLLNNNG